MASISQDFYRYFAFQPPPGPAFKVTDYDLDKDAVRLPTVIVTNAAMHSRGQVRVKLRPAIMPAVTAAFRGSGHASPTGRNDASFAAG
jgi:hypothetical protein